MADRRYGATNTLTLKVPCRAATTSAITLSGIQTIDGVTLNSGDRVLVKDQADQTTNGIYNCLSGAWTRDTDANSSTLFIQGMLVLITSGSVNAGVIYQLTTSNPITLTTSLLVFVLYDYTNVLVNNNIVIKPLQAPTISAPTYVKGGLYFDTTLNKLRVGGATVWETVTSVST